MLAMLTSCRQLNYWRDVSSIRLCYSLLLLIAPIVVLAQAPGQTPLQQRQQGPEVPDCANVEIPRPVEFLYPDVTVLKGESFGAWIYYAIEVNTGKYLVAINGEIEPFVVDSSHMHAVGIFSGRRIIHPSKPPAGQDRVTITAGGYVQGTSIEVVLKRRCEATAYSALAPAAQDARMAELEEMREAMQLFTRQERGGSSFGYRSDCAGIEYPTGYLGRRNLALSLKWRNVYAISERHDVPRCAGHLELTSGAQIGDPIGDGTILLALPYANYQRQLVFRADERTGLPIGKIPSWVKILPAEEVISFRNQFRRLHRCPVRGTSLRLPGDETCAELIVQYQDAWRRYLEEQLADDMSINARDE